MGLCVLALLCQMLVVPVMASPSVASIVTRDVTTDGASVSDVIGYNEYVAQNPGDPATDDVVIPAIDAKLGDEEVIEPEDTPEVDAPEAEASVPVKEDTEAVTKTEDSLIFNAIDSSAEWTVQIPKTGWYKVSFTFAGVEGSGSGSDMELGLLVNGKYPFSEAESFVLPRTWIDVAEDYDGDGELDYVREDPKGNQFAPE